jgi:outer membrane lipoprotein-sorting protein
MAYGFATHLWILGSAGAATAPMLEIRHKDRAFVDGRERPVLPFSAMLNTFRRVLSGVAAGALLAASPALADWEADVQTKSKTPSSGEALQEMKGKAYGRNNMMRMDLETPHGPMSTIVDRDKRSVVTLMHSQKMVMQADANRYDANIPSCNKKDIDACFLEQGYKKTGTEQANGHPCAVYEKDQKLSRGGTVHLKLWKPTDFKEAVIVRSQAIDASGSTSEMNLTNLKVKAQPDSLFNVPSDYRSMQGPGAAGPGGRGGRPGPIDPSEFQGKSPEEIREMLMKRYGQAPDAPQEDKE